VVASVAVFKWALDPQDVRVGADGSVDWRGARPEVGDDDHAAAAVARAAAGDGEVVGLTLAGGDVAWAAARGAARTVVVEGVLPAADATGLARVLAAAVRSVGDVDVVAIGDTEWDPAVPAALAGELGWPALLAVDSAEVVDGQLRVTRRAGAGTQDVVVRRPVVLGVAARRAEQDKPGMREVLNARKKPVTTVSLAELGVDVASALSPRGSQLPPRSATRVFDGADPEQAVAQLVTALRADGVL
jgi:electron transfer flavoprotein beta subunit